MIEKESFFIRRNDYVGPFWKLNSNLQQFSTITFNF